MLDSVVQYGVYTCLIKALAFGAQASGWFDNNQVITTDTTSDVYIDESDFEDY